MRFKRLGSLGKGAKTETNILVSLVDMVPVSTTLCSLKTIFETLKSQSLAGGD